MTACNPATYVFYDGTTTVAAGTITSALSWWPSDWPPYPYASPGGQYATATSLADAKTQCDAHAQCDAFAFHNPPTTSVAQSSWYGYLYMYKLRQTKGDHTLSQWLDAVTWTSTNPYGGGGGPDYRLFWAIDECLV